MESVHLKLKKYSCSLCPITFADPSALKRHTERHKINMDNRQFKCNECGHTFLLQQHLRNHMGQIHSGKVTCDICNKQLSKSGIMHHRKTAHSALSEVKCSQCELVFGDKGYLRKHLLTHTVDKEQKDFKCDQCDKAYHRQEYLSKHIRYKHNNSEEGKWQCKTCNKTFAQSGGLFMHKKSHESKREFKCDICGNEYNYKSVLKKHMLIHDGVKPYKCGECEKSFDCQSLLVNHQGVHTGDKPFKCDKCGTGYTWKSNLKYHITKCLLK